MIGGAAQNNNDDDGNEACENLLRPNKKISLNDFELVKVIGRGSFGKVYMVRRNGTENFYAMKKLRKDVVAKRNLLVKTQAERDILEKIDSPFIVKLHYAFQTPAKLYFVMDFLNGGELFYHLRKDQKFSERRACFYTAQLVEALRCLHRNGIIYRDLKPENVLLDHEGYIKITDFGLSKQGLATNKPGARTFSYCGTPEYLAPEIIQGVGHGKAADWWSLVSIQSFSQHSNYLKLFYADDNYNYFREPFFTRCCADDPHIIKRTENK